MELTESPAEAPSQFHSLARTKVASIARNAFRKLPAVSFWLSLLCVCAISLPTHVSAGAATDLQQQKNLTPESLIKHFAGFAYELGDRVQEPDTFLQRRRGDCDDFAALVENILTKRGYHTKLVVIMMDRETHVVCYVKEAGGFLDFNFRNEAKPVIESDGSLEDIAGKVSGYFRSKWRMVSEFKYEGERPVFVDSVFPITPAPVQKEVASVDSVQPSSSAKSPTVVMSEVLVQ